MSSEEDEDEDDEDMDEEGEEPQDVGPGGTHEAEHQDIREEHIAADIVSSSWTSLNGSKRGTAHVPDMLLQREINAKHPFSSHDKVRISQQPQYIPANSTTRFQYDHQVFCGQYSQDGSVYMSACQDRHLRLYDTQTWKQTKDILAEDIGWSIIDTDYSPDQRWLIYSSWSEYVHLCNVHGEFEIHDALHFKPNSNRFCLFSIKFSPDSNEILGGSSDRHLYVYNIDRKEPTVKVEGHGDDINTVCFLDNSGNLFVSGSDDHLVKVWDRRIMGMSSSRTAGVGCVGVLPGHTHGITHVSPKGDGRYVISNGKDQSIKLWDVRSMLSPGTYKGHTGGRRAQQWDYRYNFGLGSGSNTRTRDDKSIMTYRGHRVLQTLIRAYFSPACTTGQKYIYTGSYDGSVYIYDVLSGSLVKRLKGHMAIIRDLSWHPYENSLMTSSWDGSVCQWTAGEPDRKENVPAQRRMRFADYY